jgi:sugar lactone lactonase YvrE
MSRRLAISLSLVLTVLLLVGSAPLAVRAQEATPLGASITASPTAASTPRVLVQGAGLHGANGLAFDSQDRLHIASWWGHSITVVDPETGAILAVYGPEEGVDGPDDLAVAADGSLYWTDLLTGEVGRRAPDGTTTSQLVAPGVNPITVADDGRLFVALDFLGDALYELDPVLVAPPRLIAEDLGFLNGFDWGPDGHLYGPILTQGRVVRIAVDAEPATVETVAEGFGLPVAVKFDGQRRLHVLDADTGDVIRVDPETGEQVVLTTLAPGLDNLAFDSRDRLFVSSSDDGFVVEVLPDGGSRIIVPGGLIAPGGVAAVAAPNGGERVIVADLWTLRAFDATSGAEQSVTHSSLVDPAGLISPLTVAANGENLLLSTWLGAAVQVWDPQTRQAVARYSELALPSNAVRFQDAVVVAALGAEPGAAQVVRLSASAATPRPEPLVLADATAGIQVPLGLATTEDDLWVGDWATGTIWQVIADGTVLTPPRPVASGLAAPEGLAAVDGGLLVVEAGAGRLTRIDLETGAIETVAEGLALGAAPPTGAPPMGVFNGVAVGPSGTIYVTGDTANVLYAITPEPVAAMATRATPELGTPRP